jgi:hypothetical protein
VTLHCAYPNVFVILFLVLPKIRCETTWDWWLRYVSQVRELTGPEVGCTAGFHSHQTGQDLALELRRRRRISLDGRGPDSDTTWIVLVTKGGVGKTVPGERAPELKMQGMLVTIVLEGKRFRAVE